MEDSFDLDVNNYTPSDLINFFKLNESYTINDLVKKAEELARVIFSPNTSSYNAKYKNGLSFNQSKSGICAASNNSSRVYLYIDVIIPDTHLYVMLSFSL